MQTPATRLPAALSLLLGCLVAVTTFGGPHDWKPEASWGPYRERGTGKLIKKAELAEKKGKYKNALRLYRKIQKESVNLKNKGKALVKQGDCLEQMEEPWKAFEKYREAVDEYRSHIAFSEVLEAEFALSKQFGHKKQRDRFLFVTFSTEDKAVDILDHIVTVGPYSKVAPKAMHRVGIIRIAQKDYESAIMRFRRLLKQHPRHALAADGRLDLARALLLEAEAGDGDGTLVREARASLDRFIESYPEHARFDEAKALVLNAESMEATRLLDLAQFYLREAHYRPAAAKQYLSDIVMHYPGSGTAGLAQIMLNSLERRQSNLEKD